MTNLNIHSATLEHCVLLSAFISANKTVSAIRQFFQLNAAAAGNNTVDMLSNGYDNGAE